MHLPKLSRHVPNPPHPAKVCNPAAIRRPAIPLVAILSLALGISAAICVFSLLEHIILHPFPYRDADRIVELTYGEKLEIEYTPAISSQPGIYGNRRHDE